MTSAPSRWRVALEDRSNRHRSGLVAKDPNVPTTSSGKRVQFSAERNQVRLISPRRTGPRQWRKLVTGTSTAADIGRGGAVQEEQPQTRARRPFARPPRSLSDRIPVFEDKPEDSVSTPHPSTNNGPKLAAPQPRLTQQLHRNRTPDLTGKHKPAETSTSEGDQPKHCPVLYANSLPVPRLAPPTEPPARSPSPKDQPTASASPSPLALQLAIRRPAHRRRPRAWHRRHRQRQAATAAAAEPTPEAEVEDELLALPAAYELPLGRLNEYNVIVPDDEVCELVRSPPRQSEQTRAGTPPAGKQRKALKKDRRSRR
ncbi:uncharacterized protein MONBRDRAFT_12257 [Monosiga brevicollis MX1]|uniref:Uncharacterized protein n=1 Tax=Monosiga brevicollis TaxID=81824 RepID=A9VBP8_MONBE|nr:uncharacterized protein MONBRDRAFT_12257 [Monosiga brevicollis MX1]EDQ84970.1 predicted protein [Monosiga brevicollis MX1]|eukprot:XP_001750140.1 hypothetical protein [Monosiga brevicollis MX1]